jgi:hypothetical protein
MEYRKERYMHCDTDIEKIWESTMDDSGVLLQIEALMDAKIGNK